MDNDERERQNRFRLMVVDDDKVIREMLFQVFQNNGYECLVAENGYKALELLENEYFDIIITDINMPGMSGIELLKLIKKAHDTDVIAMTGYIENYSYESIIEKGASDFVQKPISTRELMVRVKRVLRERSLLAGWMQAHQELESALQELHDAYLDTINRLVMAAEYKDENTGGHIIRISRYSAMIAMKLGLPHNEIQSIYYSAPMHDVGKIGIPDSILLKPGKLTEEEFTIMKTHTTIGASILSNSKADILKYACQIALSHHERWDGEGYPLGLSKKDIPLPGRIVGIADVFDALTSVRPYKASYPVEFTLDIIKNERGAHFDPDITDVFLEHADEVIRIKEEVGSKQHFSPSDFFPKNVA